MPSSQDIADEATPNGTLGQSTVHPTTRRATFHGSRTISMPSLSRGPVSHPIASNPYQIDPCDGFGARIDGNPGFISLARYEHEGKDAIMTGYQCDWHKTCQRMPYAEVYYSTCPEFECVHDPHHFSWNYLCWWHFQYERIERFVHRRPFYDWSLADGE